MRSDFPLKLDTVQLYSSVVQFSCVVSHMTLKTGRPGGLVGDLETF